MKAYVVEVSKGGLQLQTDRALPIGAQLAMETDDGRAERHVRHCGEDAENSFIVGVRIDETGVTSVNSTDELRSP